jgi:hypothetical protein
MNKEVYLIDFILQKTDAFFQYIFNVVYITLSTNPTQNLRDSIIDLIFYVLRTQKSIL